MFLRRSVYACLCVAAAAALLAMSCQPQVVEVGPAGADSAVAALAQTPAPQAPKLADYALPGQLDPLPAGTAALYCVPWRSNVRTVSAAAALDGVGVYYKHIPGDWTLAQHTNVMKQLAALGVQVTQIARGIPSGSPLEYASKTILSDALAGRRRVE